MEFWQNFLPIIIYVLLIVLIVVLIIFTIKGIALLNRVNNVVDDVEKKVSALDGLFAVISNVSGRVNYIYDKLTDTVLGLADRVFTKKKKDEEDEDIDE